ncbi:DUF4332 domain-containing protein [Phycisphaera mikurensis]|uniref:DUF4332 domain-containing protein n=1 Tax=Phycisphaera mikurensis (strain NBRC 102666 / KCTC 22515 / FYK2301M01) TaxID=1142394 RepID=I0IEP5_PHYMF|nr:DUF4332 domain-containing protein [Phycisphaera mikurensis]MBB6441530.1 putative flap endonuclease-1-like 5' DNA nuclease [Phycisphaera mikurensis]BAM03733.1 hypothetical protein PSMK_15740 [Phycisphaera mikurensis NBRC 102666]
MAYKIIELEGIGPVKSVKYNTAGIETTEQLLDACGDAKKRRAFAAEHGMDASEVLRHVNMADLMRISGVGEEYSDLLEAAGVDTVKELRTRNPQNLTASMAAVNEAKKLVRSLPTESKVAGWISQAKELEPRVTH